MRNKSTTIIIVALVFLLTGCQSTRNITKDLPDTKGEYSDLEYYSTFTEATKHALLNNKKLALKLYHACIDYNPKGAAAYFQISNIYMQGNNLELAKSYGIKAAELEKDNFWYQIHVANLYQFENMIDSAIYYYEHIVQLTDNPEFLYNLAILYSKNEDNLKALDITRELEQDFKGSKEIFLMRHNIYHNLKQYDSAVVALEGLIYYFPEEFQNYGLLAEYLSEIKRNDYAREVYTKLITLEPENGLVNISYGDFLYSINQYDSAFHYYKIAMQADDLLIENKLNIVLNFLNDPVGLKRDKEKIGDIITLLKEVDSDYRIYTVSADFNIKLQQYDSAIVDLEHVLIYEKNNYVIWEKIILLENYMDNHTNVIFRADSALVYFPQKSKIHLVKAYSEFFLEKYRGVITSCENGLALKNTEEEQIQFYNLMADAYREIEQFDSSDYYYEIVLEIDPNNLMIRNNYSYYLSLRSEKLDYAEELSKLTVRLEPTNATYLDTYGWILFKLGKTKEAKKYIENAIRNGAYNNSEVLDHYGDIMKELGRCLEAIEAYEKAYSYDTSNVDIKNKIDSLKNECKE